MASGAIALSHHGARMDIIQHLQVGLVVPSQQVTRVPLQPQTPSCHEQQPLFSGSGAGS